MADSECIEVSKEAIKEHVTTPIVAAAVYMSHARHGHPVLRKVAKTKLNKAYEWNLTFGRLGLIDEPTMQCWYDYITGCMDYLTMGRVR